MDQDSTRSGPDSHPGFIRPPPLIPDSQVLRQIGGGSYGEVWLMKNVVGTHRAVKVVYRDRFSDRRPYEREFEGISNFEPISQTNSHHVRIFHAGRNEAAGYFYYIMELADDLNRGQTIDPACYKPKTLRSLLQQREPIPVPEALEIALQLTVAMKELHDAGLIHRDIKPSNVIFVDGRPKLADVGLVATANQECSFVGTEGYVPREGPGKVQADIYSLGKVMYEMFTGLPPERYPSLPEDLALGASKSGREFNEVILKACEPNVARRYQTAAEIASDLDLLVRGKSVLRQRRLESAYRRLLITTGGLAVTIVLAGLVFGFFLFKRRADEQNLRRELREIQLTRARRPWAGWFEKTWPRLRAAASVRADNDLQEQASAMLAGWDARVVKAHQGLAGGYCAFGTDGRAVISSLGTNAALIMDTNGATTTLPINGEGPVCWPDAEPPLQLTVVSNDVVVRAALTGKSCRTLLHLRETETNPKQPPVLALAPDGSTAAIGMTNGVSVWSVSSGGLLGKIPGEVASMAFSCDGSLLGIGWDNGTTSICKMTNLSNPIVLPATSRPSPVRALAFTRDRLVTYGKHPGPNSWLVATADQGTQIVIWDLQRRLPRAFCRGSSWTVNTLAFHPDGLILASAGQAEARLWDVTRGTPLFSFDTGATQVRFVAFDRRGDYVAFGSQPEFWKPRVSLWRLESGRGIYPLLGLEAAARKIWFSGDGRRLAALSDEWQLGVWSTESHRLTALLETPEGASADNAGGTFDLTGDRFAFAAGREACLFDLKEGVVAQTWALNDGLTDQLQFDPDGRLLLLRREKGQVPAHSIWRLYQLSDSATPALLHEQTDTNWSALNMAFLSGGRRFLVWNGRPGDHQQVVHAIDTFMGRELWRGTNSSVQLDMKVFVTPDQEQFGFSTTDPNGFKVFSASTFQPTGKLDRFAQAFTRSGDQFLVSQWILPGNRGESVIPLVTDWLQLGYVCAFSPDGAQLAAATDEGVVTLANTREVRDHLARLRAPTRTPP